MYKSNKEWKILVKEFLCLERGY
uniref:Uncharacterized protein n=1 Tax=Arundo donax TaxID=35708 RepID=A0A0A9FRT8_ARUDO